MTTLEKIHEEAQVWAESRGLREIWANQTDLVIDLMAQPLGEELGYTWENVNNLYDEETEEYKDVYQWYLVSPWLFEALDALGYPVLDTTGGYYWGRESYGMHIVDEGILQDVYTRYFNHK